jgi:Flp pilus assembly protein TadD
VSKPAPMEQGQIRRPGASASEPGAPALVADTLCPAVEVSAYCMILRGEQTRWAGETPEDRERVQLAAERALALEPGRLEARVLWARSVRGGRPLAWSRADEATARAREMLGALDASSHPAARSELARIEIESGNAEAAASLLVTLAGEFPRDAEIANELGIVRLAQGQTRGATEQLTRAVQLAPNEGRYWTTLGTVQLLAGAPEVALRSFRQALQLRPGDAQAHGDLGVTLTLLGQIEEAVPHLERAIHLEPKAATFRSNLAYARYLGGAAELAESLARDATRLDPELGSAWLTLGLVLASRAQYEEAESCVRRALEINPVDPRAQVALQDLAELRKAPLPEPAH